MANGVILYPNYVNADPRFATVDIKGGSWRPTLPLQNLLTSSFAEKCRSTGVTEQDTQFTIDLGVRRATKGGAIVGHNMTSDARVAFEYFNDTDPNNQGSSLVPVNFTEATYLAANPDVSALITSGAYSSAYDHFFQVGLAENRSGSGCLVEVFPKVYPKGAVDFDDESFWFGQVTDENADITPIPVIRIFDERVIGRYVRVRIRNVQNPADYVELSRIFVSPGFQSSINFVYGAQLGLEDRSPVFTARSGAEYFDSLPTRRTAVIQYTNIPTDEALANIFDGNLRSGITEQVFFSYDPDNETHRQRWSFPATLSRLSPLEASAFGVFSTAIQLREVVA